MVILPVGVNSIMAWGGEMQRPLATSNNAIAWALHCGGYCYPYLLQGLPVVVLYSLQLYILSIFISYA